MWAILLALVVCHGQSAAPGPAKSVIGEVTSIDAAAKAIKIKLLLKVNGPSFLMGSRAPLPEPCSDRLHDIMPHGLR